MTWCCVPAIFNSPGWRGEARTRPQKKSTSLSKWNSGRSLGLAGTSPPPDSPCLIFSSSHLVLFLHPAFHPPGGLVLNVFSRRSDRPGVFKLVHAHLQKKSFLSKGCVGRGGFKGLHFQVLNFYICSFPKLILPERKLIKKIKLSCLTSSFMSPFLQKKRHDFSLQSYPRCIIPGHKALQGAKETLGKYLYLSLFPMPFFQPHRRRP